MSKKYWITAAGSKWTNNETEMLNVEDVVLPWRELLRPEFRNIDSTSNEILKTLLQPITKKVRELDQEAINDLLDSGLVGAALAAFYDEMMELTRLKGDPGEDAELEFVPPMPEAVTKRRKLSRAVKERPTSAHSYVSIPRSSSDQSLSSVSSDSQGTFELVTERAFHNLLAYILRVSLFSKREKPILALRKGHFEREIKLSKKHPGCKVSNDGSIVVARSDNPLINIECKSRDGTSGQDIYEKLFAQEFAEILSIMLHRGDAMFKWSGVRTKTYKVIYSFSVHHRRAYMTRVEFSDAYLDAILSGKLQNEPVVVQRSEASYRMDDVRELKELITMIFCLFEQLEADIKAGHLG